MSKKYRPSNGTEGEAFQSQWCDRCAKQADCEIVAKTMMYSVDEPEYPEEWRRDDEGWPGNPRCEAFEKQIPPDPDGLNGGRAELADNALISYQCNTGCDREDALADLLAGLMHLCDRDEFTFSQEVARAARNYRQETGQ